MAAFEIDLENGHVGDCADEEEEEEDDAYGDIHTDCRDAAKRGGCRRVGR